MKSFKQVASLIEETLCKDCVADYSSVALFLNISEKKLQIKFSQFGTVGVNEDENLIPLVCYCSPHGFWKDHFYRNDVWTLSSYKIASDCVNNMMLFGYKNPPEVRSMIYEFLIREFKNDNC